MLSEPSKTAYDIEFAVAGIPVRINPFFWLLAVVLGWYDTIAIAELILWVGCVFISILVHELGHAWATKRFGDNRVRIVLYGLGGLAVSAGHLNRRERILQLLSGPGAGFLLFLLAFFLLKMVPVESTGTYSRFVVYQLIYINLVWGLLNLLPVYPLDGGQILDQLIGYRRPWDSKILTARVSIVFSVICACIFAVLAIAAIFGDRDGGDWFPVLVFISLAVVNFQLLKTGGFDSAGGYRHDHRDSWERDPNWWKK